MVNQGKIFYFVLLYALICFALTFRTRYMTINLLDQFDLIKKLRMFNKLKNLFVEDDGKDTPSDDNQNDATAKPPKSREEKFVAPSTSTPKSSAPKTDKKSTPPVSTPPTNTSGAINDKFMNVLIKAINDQDLPSFDYLEFKESLKSLSKMPMDEQTRFQSAFAVGKTMGATPKKLIDAAEFYIRVLGEEDSKFQQALVNRQSTQVDGGKKELAQLEKNIQARKKQIEDLNKQIELDLKKREELKQQVQNASGKMTKTKNDFSVTYNHLVGQIRADIEKMKRYLK